MMMMRRNTKTRTELERIKVDAAWAMSIELSSVRFMLCTLCNVHTLLLLLLWLMKLSWVHTHTQEEKKFCRSASVAKDVRSLQPATSLVQSNVLYVYVCIRHILSHVQENLCGTACGVWASASSFATLYKIGILFTQMSSDPEWANQTCLFST